MNFRVNFRATELALEAVTGPAADRGTYRTRPPAVQ
jgi:hypothetical protein